MEAENVPHSFGSPGWVEEEWRRVLRYARTKICGPDAKDRVQDAFLLALEKNPRLLDDKEGAIRWLNAVVKNRYLNSLGGPEFVELSADEGGIDIAASASREGDPEYDLEMRMLRGVLFTVINELSEYHATIVTLHHLDGFSIADVALKLGMKANRVKGDLLIARKKLSKCKQLRVLFDQWEFNS